MAGFADQEVFDIGARGELPAVGAQGLLDQLTEVTVLTERHEVSICEMPPDLHDEYRRERRA